MKNRAKCKKCQNIIESFHLTDYVSCKCGEIAISGGQNKLEAYAVDFTNFLRVDDNDNEVLVEYKDSPKEKPENLSDTPPKVITKKELIDILDEMIKSDESLPEQALHAQLTYYDLIRYMMLISNILKKE
jgi:hypothetical protein